MKYILSLLLLLALLPATHAQMGLNSPAGLAPRQDMEIYPDYPTIQHHLSPLEWLIEVPIGLFRVGDGFHRSSVGWSASNR